MDYSKKDDWKINKDVREKLVISWINVLKLRIDCTKGNVEIKGDVEFTGKEKSNVDSPIVAMNLLKKMDARIRAIPNVKTVKYSLTGWKKLGGRWQYTPTKEQEKQDQFGQENKT